jgi:hypothetical protein
MKTFVVISILLFAFPLLNAQQRESKYHNRSIITQSGDTVIQANILTGDLQLKLDPKKRYFWYTKGQIHSNYGGVGGKLFHGTYQAYLNNTLVVSGQFKEGLKSGLWNSWYLTGNLREISNWSDGCLDGKYYYYSENRILEKRGTYKNGTFHSNLRKRKTKLPPKLTSDKSKLTENTINVDSTKVSKKELRNRNKNIKAEKK